MRLSQITIWTTHLHNRISVSANETVMTTLAGGFLVTNYHNPGHKDFKSSLDQGRKQKRPLGHPAVDTWCG